jgi:hypothetical protein
MASASSGMLGIAFGVVAIFVIVFGVAAIDNHFSERATTLRAIGAAPQVRIAEAKT